MKKETLGNIVAVSMLVPSFGGGGFVGPQTGGEILDTFSLRFENRAQVAELNQIARLEIDDLGLHNPEQVRRHSETIIRAAVRYGVPAELIAAVADAESGGNALALSSMGAVGVMQIMPSDNRIRPDLSIDFRPTTEELMDPEINIFTGAAILGAIYKSPQLGNLNWWETLAVYNAGFRESMRWGANFADDVYERVGWEMDGQGTKVKKLVEIEE